MEGPAKRRANRDNEDKWFEGYGDNYQETINNNKQEQEQEQQHEPFLVGSLNAHYIGEKGTPQLFSLQDAIKGNTVQGLSELNTNFSRVPAHDQLQERMKNTWRAGLKCKNTWIREKDFRKSASQLGGVALMTHGDTSSYAQEMGEDEEGLARWNWMCLEGMSRTKTTVIQVYRPVKNTENSGSVYMQQASRIPEDDVLKKYDEDLLQLIDGFMEGGYNIVVMGDFNLDVTNEDLFLVRELKDRGIIERITDRHGKANAPNTFRWGSTTIDGIFSTREMEIIRCGYTAGDPKLSDHRMAWAEFTKDAVLGIDCGDMFKPPTRRLQCKYKKVVKKFNQFLMKQMHTHKLLQKAEALWSDVETTGWDDDKALRYEQLDSQFAKAVAHADKKCRKLFPDDVQFSPEVKEGMGRYSMWNEMHKKFKRKGKIHVAWVVNLKKRWNLTDHFVIPKSEEECKANLDKAWEEFKELRVKSPELRDHFLDLMIREASGKKDPASKAKVKGLKSIRSNEKKRHAHQRVGMASGKARSKGVRFVKKEYLDGTVEVISDKFRMFQTIMEANETKLHQSNNDNIPLREEKLVEALSKFDYNQWEGFIKGDIAIPEGLEKGTELWLNKFRNMPIDDIDMTCDHQELIKAWSKVKEKTSSLPHPIHYGTMKTMKWCQSVAKYHTIMANIPLVTGYSPNSWQTDVEAMLQKKEGEWRVDKLQRISLLHPAFNMNNRRIGRAAMKEAEKRGLLADKQYGSRKKRFAEKHALNKRLLLDVMRVSRTPGVLSANDAKSCYDRILHFATYVSLRRVGIPKAAVVSMIDTLRKMKHKVRTAFGDSEDTYGGDPDDDPHGASQGNAAGPAIWALVSSPLLDILREQGYGAKFISPLRKEFINICGFAFVDDTDTIQTAEYGTDTVELVRLAQEELDLWETLIRSTGGAIVGEKSDYTVINWVWRNGKPYYEPKNEETIMEVRNEHGERETLAHLPTHEARRTLGVWQAADGNEKKQTEIMKEKIRTWADSINKSSLSKGDVHLGVKTSLYPSAMFGLMATTLSKDQCKEVFTPIRKMILPRMKICRNTPKALVHGPRDYGGLEIKDIYTLQGIAHMKAILAEASSPSATGKLMRILNEYHILEIGLCNTIYDMPFDTIKDCMTNTWMKRTLEFLWENDIEIKSDDTRIKTGWTENDTNLMQDAIDEGYSGKALAAINRCRMHMKALFRSDISDISGNEVTLEAFNVQTTGRQSTSSKEYNWQIQERPSSADRTMWRRFLKKTYNIERTEREWEQPCGQWRQEATAHA